MSKADFDCDVLIVGAGPVGLALATELTHRGIAVRVVEQNDRVGLQPRAKTTNVRTMEHMRRWGLAPEMRSRSTMRGDEPRRVLFSTTLFGHAIYAFENALAAQPVHDERYPEHAEFIPQYVVETILRDHVATHPLATLTMQRRCDGLTQDADGVTATITDVVTSAEETVRARYLVGADGPRSATRKRLGIEMRGQSGLVSFVTLVLDLPGLRGDPALTPAMFHWLVTPAAPAIMAPMGKGDVWFWSTTIPKDAAVATEDLLPLARAGIGRDVEMTVLARDDWTAHRLIADRYGEGRVFLAGDACHLHAPFGGHGMNLGIGDAVDLGWKIAAVLEGWADPALLDTYEPERRPVHEWVLASSTENMASLSNHFAAPDLDDDGPGGEAARARAAKAIDEAKSPEFRSLGIVLGYSYAGSPAVAEEAGGPPLATVTRFEPSAYPGSRAPHAWLADGSSLYDRFGGGFALLRTEGAATEGEQALVRAAERAGVPLTIVAPDEARLRSLYEARYALIRPDQHVAWRGSEIADPDGLVAMVRGTGARVREAHEVAA